MIKFLHILVFEFLIYSFHNPLPVASTALVPVCAYTEKQLQNNIYNYNWK
jgi:hypothetical protein